MNKIVEVRHEVRYTYQVHTEIEGVAMFRNFWEAHELFEILCKTAPWTEAHLLDAITGEVIADYSGYRSTTW